MVGALAHAGATRSLTDSEQQLFSAGCKTATKVRQSAAFPVRDSSPFVFSGCTLRIDTVTQEDTQGKYSAALPAIHLHT